LQCPAQPPNLGEGSVLLRA